MKRFIVISKEGKGKNSKERHKVERGSVGVTINKKRRQENLKTERVEREREREREGIRISQCDLSSPHKNK